MECHKLISGHNSHVKAREFLIPYRSRRHFNTVSHQKHTKNYLKNQTNLSHLKAICILITDCHRLARPFTSNTLNNLLDIQVPAVIHQLGDKVPWLRAYDDCVIYMFPLNLLPPFSFVRLTSHWQFRTFSVKENIKPCLLLHPIQLLCGILLTWVWRRCPHINPPWLWGSEMGGWRSWWRERWGSLQKWRLGSRQEWGLGGQ